MNALPGHTAWLQSGRYEDDDRDFEDWQEIYCAHSDAVVASDYLRWLQRRRYEVADVTAALAALARDDLEFLNDMRRDG